MLFIAVLCVLDSAGSNTRNSNSTAWAIVIGTALAVGVVSLIVYIWKRRRGHRDFNHRKLVEDLPRGPGRSDKTICHK